MLVFLIQFEKKFVSLGGIFVLVINIIYTIHNFRKKVVSLLSVQNYDLGNRISRPKYQRQNANQSDGNIFRHHPKVSVLGPENDRFK
jgi:hypothetical protein